eukprot:CAMPEP_0117619108 /NCGR_PEP_ID=MMETSP0784-20121206/86449_1 /TAXON_ID=39447 /ORGANISM="" /LENGTH=106 /DNA_ID=CAMNT_0005422993 /DNA_START=98 /DNA_END=418 /DNA_ORIENTATION=-
MLLEVYADASQSQDIDFNQFEARLDHLPKLYLDDHVVDAEEAGGLELVPPSPEPRRVGDDDALEIHVTLEDTERRLVDAYCDTKVDGLDSELETLSAKAKIKKIIA